MEIFFLYPQNGRAYPHLAAVIHRLFHSLSTGRRSSGQGAARRIVLAARGPDAATITVSPSEMRDVS
jgi:hypothetical protein